MNQQYDERQLFLRYKYGYQSLLVMTVLIIVNAFICETVYQWADLLISSMSIVMLSVGYFGFRTALAGADAWGAGTRHYNRMMLIVDIMYVVLTIVFFADGDFTLIEDGMATSSVLYLVTLIAVASTSAVYWFNLWKNKNRSKE